MQCAERILGVGTPRPNYANYTQDDWIGAIDRQLEYSGLIETIGRLTTDMVKKAQQRALVYEGEQLKRYLHKASAEQKCVATSLSPRPLSANKLKVVFFLKHVALEKTSKRRMTSF